MKLLIVGPSYDDMFFSFVEVLKQFQLVYCHALTGKVWWQFNNGFPHHRQTDVSEKANNSLRRRPQHCGKQGYVSILNFAGGNIEYLMHRCPKECIWERVLALSPAKIAKSQRSESGSQRGHPICMGLLADEWAVRSFAPPSKGTSSRFGFLAAMETPEGGTNDAVFRPQDIYHMVAFVDE